MGVVEHPRGFVLVLLPSLTRPHSYQGIGQKMVLVIFDHSFRSTVPEMSRPTRALRQAGRFMWPLRDLRSLPDVEECPDNSSGPVTNRKTCLAHTRDPNSFDRDHDHPYGPGKTMPVSF